MVIFDTFKTFSYLCIMDNKHAQVPNQLFNDTLEFGDKLVYAQIRKYVNKDTLQCYPRLDTIANDCQLSIKTVKSAVDRLEKAGLLTVYKRKGTSSIYKFHKLEDGFERFSEEFTDRSPDRMYGILVGDSVKEQILSRLIMQKTEEYIARIKEMSARIEIHPAILKIGEDLKEFIHAELPFDSGINVDCDSPGIYFYHHNFSVLG